MIEKIYLRYRMEGNGVVEISACYEKTFRKSSPVMFAFSEENTLTRHCSDEEIYSDKKPREILNELEQIIKNKTNELPSSRDILAIMKETDNDQKYKNHERHIGFQPIATHPLKNEPTDAFVKRAEAIDERNRNLHSKLLPIYREYVKRFKKQI